MRDKTLKRMLELADIKPIIKESKETLLSSMEIVKKSIDGNTYAIVRENKKYFIKSTKTKENLKESDFNYIGGIQNKTKKSFNSFSDVTKHLNLMFEEINNHSNVDNVNILESDLLNEKKYILKLKKPKTEPAPAPAPVEDEFGGGEEGGDEFDFGTEGEEGGDEFDFDAEGEGGDEFDFDVEGEEGEVEEFGAEGEEGGDEFDFDAEGEGGEEFDFDAEGEGGEELDVELDDDLEGSSIKDIQSTTGVLGQQIRDTEDISSDMQKWVAKSVLSALDLDNMDVKDKQDIINTVKSADKEIEVGAETTDEFSFEDEIEESSDELGLNVSKTTEPDVQTWETPPNSESGYGDQKRMPWESNNRGYDEDNPDIGGDEDERIAEPGKAGEDMLILDVIDDDSYDIPNAEAEALYGPNTYPEYSREPSYRAKKQADKDIRTHYYKSAPPGFETDPSDEWRKHKLPYDTKFLDEDDDTWYKEMEDVGILAPNTYEEELGLPPATKESVNEVSTYSIYHHPISDMDDRNKKIVKKGVLHKDTIKVIKQLAEKMETSTEDFEVFKESVNEAAYDDPIRKKAEEKYSYIKQINVDNKPTEIVEPGEYVTLETDYERTYSAGFAFKVRKPMDAKELAIQVSVASGWFPQDIPFQLKTNKKGPHQQSRPKSPVKYEFPMGPTLFDESVNGERAYLGQGEFIDRMDTMEQERSYEDIEDMASQYGYTIGWCHKEKTEDPEETLIFLDVKNGSENILKVRINSAGDMEIGQMEGKKFVGEPIDSFSDFDEVLNEKQIDEDMGIYDDITMAPKPQRAPEEEPARPQVDPGVPEKEPPSKRPSRQPFTPPPYIDPGDEPGPKAGDETVAPPKPSHLLHRDEPGPKAGDETIAPPKPKPNGFPSPSSRPGPFTPHEPYEGDPPAPRV